jgi:hypothetical protein
MCSKLVIVPLSTKNGLLRVICFKGILEMSVRLLTCSKELLDLTEEEHYQILRKSNTC